MRIYINNIYSSSTRVQVGFLRFPMMTSIIINLSAAVLVLETYLIVERYIVELQKQIVAQNQLRLNRQWLKYQIVVGLSRPISDLKFFDGNPIPDEA